MFGKILVPLDYNDVARRPVELALGLGRAHGARVVLLSVVDDSFPNPDIMSFQLPWADYHRHLREAAQARLEKLKSEVKAGDETEVCILRGQPARTIVRFAQEERYDLIVMATHGTAGLHGALVGSVTRKVLHDATCPVLVVRLHQDEDSP